LSRGGGEEDVEQFWVFTALCRLPEYGTVQFHEWLSIFRRNLLPPYSGYKRNGGAPGLQSVTTHNPEHPIYKAAKSSDIITDLKILTYNI
jgi:hypothetical protein